MKTYTNQLLSVCISLCKRLEKIVLTLSLFLFYLIVSYEIYLFIYNNDKYKNSQIIDFYTDLIPYFTDRRAYELNPEVIHPILHGQFRPMK